MDSFEKALIEAIATQFFAGVEYRTEYGTTRIEPQSTRLAQQIIDQRLPELAEKVGKKLDVEELATQVAEAMMKRLTDNPYWGDAFKKELSQAVIEKYAEMKAKQLMEAEQEKCVAKEASGEAD